MKEHRVLRYDQYGNVIYDENTEEVYYLMSEGDSELITEFVERYCLQSELIMPKQIWGEELNSTMGYNVAEVIRRYPASPRNVSTSGKDGREYYIIYDLDKTKEDFIRVPSKVWKFAFRQPSNLQERSLFKIPSDSIYKIVFVSWKRRLFIKGSIGLILLLAQDKIPLSNPFRFSRKLGFEYLRPDWEMFFATYHFTTVYYEYLTKNTWCDANVTLRIDRSKIEELLKIAKSKGSNSEKEELFKYLEEVWEIDHYDTKYWYAFREKPILLPEKIKNLYNAAERYRVVPFDVEVILNVQFFTGESRYGKDPFFTENPPTELFPKIYFTLPKRVYEMLNPHIINQFISSVIKYNEEYPSELKIPTVLQKILGERVNNIFPIFDQENGGIYTGVDKYLEKPRFYMVFYGNYRSSEWFYQAWAFFGTHLYSSTEVVLVTRGAILFSTMDEFSKIVRYNREIHHMNLATILARFIKLMYPQNFRLRGLHISPEVSDIFESGGNSGYFTSDKFVKSWLRLIPIDPQWEKTSNYPDVFFSSLESRKFEIYTDYIAGDIVIPNHPAAQAVFWEDLIKEDPEKHDLLLEIRNEEMERNGEKMRELFEEEGFIYGHLEEISEEEEDDDDDEDDDFFSESDHIE